MNQTRVRALLCGAISVMFLTACGGSNSSSAAVGGSVTGLAAGTTVSLVDNGADLLVLGNGNFVFAGRLSSQDAYNVTVATQPTGQTCLVSNGTGLIDFAGDDVNNVAISCAANVPIDVVVAGLTSGTSLMLQLMLQNNPLDVYPLTVNTDGTYAFATLLTIGALYNVTVSSQPSGQACTVANNSGAVVSLAPITPLSISCVQVP